MHIPNIDIIEDCDSPSLNKHTPLIWDHLYLMARSYPYFHSKRALGNNCAFAHSPVFFYIQVQTAHIINDCDSPSSNEHAPLLWDHLYPMAKAYPYFHSKRTSTARLPIPPFFFIYTCKLHISSMPVTRPRRINTRP
jgi:hypothetical protein